MRCYCSPPYGIASVFANTKCHAKWAHLSANFSVNLLNSHPIAMRIEWCDCSCARYRPLSQFSSIGPMKGTVKCEMVRASSKHLNLAITRQPNEFALCKQVNQRFYVFESMRKRVDEKPFPNREPHSTSWPRRVLFFALAFRFGHCFTFVRLVCVETVAMEAPWNKRSLKTCYKFNESRWKWRRDVEKKRVTRRNRLFAIHSTTCSRLLYNACAHTICL